MGAHKAFINSIRDRGTEQQLLLEGNKTLEALRQTLGLDVLKLTVVSSVRFWKTSDSAVWKGQLPPK
jgi:hypothetical protein